MKMSHVSSLSNKHADLERRLETERTRPQPDDAVVASLKKRKLRLKETIEASAPR